MHKDPFTYLEPHPRMPESSATKQPKTLILQNCGTQSKRVKAIDHNRPPPLYFAYLHYNKMSSLKKLWYFTLHHSCPYGYKIITNINKFIIFKKKNIPFQAQDFSGQVEKSYLRVGSCHNLKGLQMSAVEDPVF